ncbi:hypothetical protein RRF57_011348 [Xylaria bambusicola]|uniref:Methyltransferase domain-containing protein n=1 Tax=Xylaria bambusicola TaxID=326684 RepID=A0AAN7UZE9_9PEZI
MPCISFFRRSNDPNSSQKSNPDFFKISKLSISTASYDSSDSSVPDTEDDECPPQLNPTIQWRNPAGLLEPRILSYLNENREAIKPSKIVDLGCGNGEWLKDLKQELLETDIDAELVGYDIESKFPLPPDGIRDFNLLVERLPEESVGAFDVVRVRACAARMVNNNPTIMLSGALKLLKPGGWVQWEKVTSELILSEGYIKALRGTCEKTAQPVKASEGTQDVKKDFARELDQHLIDAEFKETEMFSGVAQESEYGEVICREIITTVTGRKPQ